MVLLFLNIHKSVVNEARSCALRTKSSSLWLALWRSLIYVLCYSSFLCVLWFVELIAIIFVKYVPKPSPHTHTHLFKIRFNIIQNIQFFWSWDIHRLFKLLVWLFYIVYLVLSCVFKYLAERSFSHLLQLYLFQHFFLLFLW